MLNRISHLKKLKLFRKFRTISYYDRNEILAAPFLSNIYIYIFFYYLFHYITLDDMLLRIKLKFYMPFVLSL